MTRLSMIGFSVVLVFCTLPSAVTRAQDTTTSDGLFQAARKAAFEEDNYPKAKQYLYKGLQLSPDYADLKIFLGRIYTWTRNYDSARILFNQVLNADVSNEDASVAYADMEYFGDQYTRALAIVEEGLKYHITSEPLLLRRARILNGQKRFTEAETAVKALLRINPNNKEGLSLATTIENNRRSNAESKVIATPPPVITSPGRFTETLRTTPEADSSSADGLLLLARKAAFDDNNYEQAKIYLYKAMRTSPGYADIKVFLGRIHTWTKNYDSARFYFNEVLTVQPGYEDASVAYADLEFWNDNDVKALGFAEEGLKVNPASADLLLRKAKILNSMRRYAEADVAVQQVLAANKNNTEARALAARIREFSAGNRVGISYDYVSFDRQFTDPWHLVSLDYGRRTGIGSITGRVNYANRFRENGIQYELDAYPRISNTFYSYVSIGFSDHVGVFPNWRGGFSLYANLPKSFEGELGFRYLKFSGDPTWIYTAYLGKYYKSWLFGARTYLTPGTFTKTVSASYNASARYYYGSADDVFGFNAGYGISPDDRFNATLIDSKQKLISYRAGFLFKKKVGRLNVFGIDGSWQNQEYLPQTNGNQYQISVSWLFRF